MQRLDGDAALYVAVSEILKSDADLVSRLPGSFHFGRLPLNTPRPALAWMIKGGPKDRNFGIVASQTFSIWFKVNTDSSDANPLPFSGAAAGARIRFLFDGSDGNRWPAIKESLNSFLRPRGWHLQGMVESVPITPGEEPLGDDLTAFVTVSGGIYSVQIQPIP